MQRVRQNIDFAKRQAEVEKKTALAAMKITNSRD